MKWGDLLKMVGLVALRHISGRQMVGGIGCLGWWWWLVGEEVEHLLSPTTMADKKHGIAHPDLEVLNKIKNFKFNERLRDEMKKLEGWYKSFSIVEQDGSFGGRRRLFFIDLT